MAKGSWQKFDPVRTGRISKTCPVPTLSRTFSREGRDPKQIQNPKNKIQNKEPANKEKLLSATSTALQPVLSADKLLHLERSEIPMKRSESGTKKLTIP